MKANIDPFIICLLDDKVSTGSSLVSIYGNQTTYAGIVVAAKKNLDESRSRLEDLKTFFGDEQNEGKNSTLT